MAFEVTGVIIAEEVLAAGVSEIALAELMPLAFETLGADVFAGLSTNAAVDTSVSQLAAQQLAAEAAAGGAGAGQGITAFTPGAVETGAAQAPNPYTDQFINAFQNPDAALNGASPYEPLASNTETQLVERAATTPTPTPTPGADSVLNAPNVNPSLSNPGYSGTGLNPTLSSPSPFTSAPSAFEQGLGAVGKFAANNPFLTGAGIYGLASATGMLDQKRQNFSADTNKTPFNNPYRFSPNFKGSNPDPKPYTVDYSKYPGAPGYRSGYAEGGIAHYDFGGEIVDATVKAVEGASPRGNSFNPQYDYDPKSGRFLNINGESAPSSYTYNKDSGKYALAAEGGIMHYYRGDLATSSGQRGDVYGATSRFLNMYDPAARYEPPPANTDVGIFRDTNPATRDKSALQATQIRNKAIAKKANVKTGANYIPPSRQLGELDFTPPGSKRDQDTDSDSILGAAHGGIMGASLGSYAAGGNPRLLKGPGDGMSDNIPATIGGYQPARLADGEFVVPADVVSGLGNGSTDAGAKKLHQMMDKVRVDRTGTKKQGKKINPNKYTPK